MEATVSCLLMLQKYCALCLGNASKGFTITNMKKKTGLKGVVDFNPMITNDISDIHKYLMERT